MFKAIASIFIFLLACGWALTNGQDDQAPADQLRQKGMCLAIRYGLKAYLAAADFQKLKQNAVSSITLLPDDQFPAEYAKAWPVIQKCPRLVAKYKLQPAMTKKQVLAIVSRLKPEECRAAVDDIPDEVIIEYYTKLMNSPEMQDKSLAEQINIIMGRYLQGNGK